MVEPQRFINLSKNDLLNQDHFNSYEPSYSNRALMAFNISEQSSNPRDKSNSLSLTRSRGLSLSLRKQNFYKKQIENQSSIFNPECLMDSQIIRVKNQQPLTKTAHTIHYLGRSISKSKIQKSRQDIQNKEKIFLQNKCTNSYLLVTNSARNYGIYTPEKIITSSHEKQKQCNIIITPPRRTNAVEQSKGSQQSSSSKIGKLSQLKKKQFIRSQKDQSIKYKNNCIQNARNKISKPPALLKNSHKDLQIKSKRQFLQSYIEKPMINSIIVSGHIENLSSQPQSPVLRLKKRLQMNSINCIFEKETLISHQNHQSRKSTIQVQQSFIVHRNISQNFRPLNHKTNLFFQGEDSPYKLYVGQQLHSKILLTIKQLPLEHFQKFAREIRIYQQVQSSRMDLKNILELFKYSTDSDKHLILKQPYTQTLHDYLQNFVMKKITRQDFGKVLKSIERIIRETLLNLERFYIFLKRKITLQDFVFVFLNIKFENLEMFGLQKSHKIEMEEALKQFLQQMQNYFNRISSGSLNI